MERTVRDRVLVVYMERVLSNKENLRVASVKEHPNVFRA